MKSNCGLRNCALHFNSPFNFFASLTKPPWDRTTEAGSGWLCRPLGLSLQACKKAGLAQFCPSHSQNTQTSEIVFPEASLKSSNKRNHEDYSSEGLKSIYLLWLMTVLYLGCQIKWHIPFFLVCGVIFKMCFKCFHLTDKGVTISQSNYSCTLFIMYENH